ncbi:MAG: PDZ domain-containing protein [Bacteroidetes bacterium]|nr:PDZ domain-containing protein [Bacteroidota bacterium]
MRKLIILLTLYSLLTAGQEPKRITRTFSLDDAVILREIGAVVTPKEERLAVEVVLGNNEQQSSDIRKGDVILMANGKKLSTMKDLRGLYEKCAPGQEFKLGVKRGESLMMVSFTRKSDEEMNKQTGGGQMVMRMEQKEGEVLLPALGLKLTTKDRAAVIIEVLPSASSNFETAVPKKGDIIRTLNGTAVASAEEFDELYTPIGKGATVTIVLARDGKEYTASFPKPQPKMMMITR